MEVEAPWTMTEEAQSVRAEEKRVGAAFAALIQVDPSEKSYLRSGNWKCPARADGGAHHWVNDQCIYCQPLKEVNMEGLSTDAKVNGEMYEKAKTDLENARRTLEQVANKDPRVVGLWKSRVTNLEGIVAGYEAKVAAGAEVSESRPATVAEKTSRPAKQASNPCLCGCGGMAKSRFIQGHDAKFHSMIKKHDAGTLKRDEIPESVLKMIDENSPEVAKARG